MWQNKLNSNNKAKCTNNKYAYAKHSKSNSDPENINQKQSPQKPSKKKKRVIHNSFMKISAKFKINNSKSTLSSPRRNPNVSISPNDILIGDDYLKICTSKLLNHPISNNKDINYNQELSQLSPRTEKKLKKKRRKGTTTHTPSIKKTSALKSPKISYSNSVPNSPRTSSTSNIIISPPMSPISLPPLTKSLSVNAIKLSGNFSKKNSKFKSCNLIEHFSYKQNGTLKNNTISPKVYPLESFDLESSFATRNIPYNYSNLDNQILSPQSQYIQRETRSCSMITENESDSIDDIENDIEIDLPETYETPFVIRNKQNNHCNYQNNDSLNGDYLIKQLPESPRKNRISIKSSKNNRDLPKYLQFSSQSPEYPKSPPLPYSPSSVPPPQYFRFSLSPKQPAKYSKSRPQPSQSCQFPVSPKQSTEYSKSSLSQLSKSQKLEPKIFEILSQKVSFPFKTNDSNILIENRHIISRKDYIDKIKNRFNEIGDQEEEKKEKKDEVNKKNSKICTLLGVGKSTLAYIYAKTLKYKYIFKLKAEKSIYLENSIIEICDILDYQQYSYLPNKKERLLFLKEKLNNNTEWLLIIDNAENIKSITNFIPEKGGDILITSQNIGELWYKFGKVLHINKLTDKELLHLLTSFYKLNTNNVYEMESALSIVQEIDSTILIKLFGHLIEQEQKKIPINLRLTPFSDYLNCFLEEKDKLQNETHIKIEHIIFSLIIKALKNNKYTNQIIDIIQILGYLSPYGIPQHFFKTKHPKINLSKLQNRKLKNSKLNNSDWDSHLLIGLNIAEKYGIISIEKNTKRIIVHRSIQRLLRNWVEKENKKNKVQLQAIQLLEQNNDNTYSNKQEIRNQIYNVLHYLQDTATLYIRLLYLDCIVSNTDIFQKNLYVHPNANNDSLYNQMNKFIYNSNKKIIVLRGNAGIGKTAYACYLTQKICKNYWDKEYQKKFIPIIVSFDNIFEEYNSKDLISNTLLAKGFETNIVRRIQQSSKKGEGNFLIIFDGYNGINRKNKNNNFFYKKIGLKKWDGKNTKFIITCRNSYLDDIKKLFKIKKEDSYIEFNLPPFNNEQIDIYINKFINSKFNNQNWDLKKYKRKLYSISGLEEILRFPLSLVLSFNIFSKIKGSHILIEDFYDIFSKQWFRREALKSQNSLNFNFEEQFFAFCNELGLNTKSNNAFITWLSKKITNLKHKQK